MIHSSALLDTHALLWLLTDRAQLSQRVQTFLLSVDSLCVSVVSLWEIAILQSLKRVTLSGTMEDLFDATERDLDAHIIHIDAVSLGRLAKLPSHHRDPFDRLIVCQALSGGYPVVTKDVLFEKYGVIRIW